MYRLVEEGAIDPMRYVQIGLRGDWPGEAEFAWQKEKGITSFFAHDVRRLGIEDVIRQTLAIVGEGVVFLTIDVDVLDPAFAPGPGRPSPAASPRRSCSGPCARSPPSSRWSERTSSR